ncbi:cache domain-containing protein [Paenibacillus sp. P26]|nr:cache domain-containing protein [Paenibacillus sp. P26]
MRKFRLFSKLKAINLTTVKAKLVIISAIILLVPSVLIGWLSFIKSQAQITEPLMNSAAVNVGLVNTYISEKVNGKKTEVDSLSQKIADVMKGKPTDAGLTNLLQEFAAANPGASAPFIGTNSGAMLIVSSQQKVPQGYDPRTTPWYKDATAQPEQVVITNPYQDDVSGQFVVTVAKAVSGNAAVVGIHVTLAELKALTQDVHIGKQGYIVIYSKNKQFFLHPTTKPGSPTQPHNEQMYDKESGTYEYMFNGRP